MWDDTDESEVGEYADYQDLPPSEEERKLAAEILVYLEHELGVDTRRIRVRVRENTVYIQGSVASHELRREIESSIPLRPRVQNLQIELSVVDHGTF